jgi:hypothetical protein
VAIGASLWVAASTAFGPVVVRLSNDQGVHTGDVVAVVVASLAAFAISVVLLWPWLRRDRPDGARRTAPALETSPRTPPASLVIAGVVAVVAAFSPAAPVGNRPADAVWTAAFAGLVALAATRARYGHLLWLAAVAAIVGVRGDAPAATMGLLALVGTVVLIATGRRTATAGCALAGLAVLALLWGPSYGATGLPSVVAAAAVAPVLWAGWSSLGPGGRRRTVVGMVGVGALVLVSSALALLAAVLVSGPLAEGARQARDGLTIVHQGDDVSRSTPVFESAAGHFRESASVLDGPLALPGRLIPFVGYQVEAMRRTSIAGADVTATARDASVQADYRSLRTEGGRLDLATMAAMQAPLDASLDAVSTARSTVAEVRSPWLLGPIDRNLRELQDELSSTEPTLEKAAMALEVAPALLGGDRPHRYLLQLATPGESRAGGGYIGTYGVLVATDGQLHLELTGNTFDLNVQEGQPPRAFDPPPGWEQLYSGFRVDRFPGNLSADPDWPTSSEVARQLYDQVPQVAPIDGAIYADPTAMAALLQLTGPVYVPSLGQTLGPTDVEQYLLIDQYVRFSEDNDARREALGDVTHAVFDALTNTDLSDMTSVIDALGPAVEGGHLKVSVFDARPQAALGELGLSGAWDPTPGADYLSLRSTDLLSNKIDTFVQRTMQVDVHPDADTGEVVSNVTITLTNTAPSGGLPWYIIGNYVGLPGGTSKDDIALYSPLDLDGATLDGTPVGMRRQPYAGGFVYSFPVQMASGQTRQLSVALRGSTPSPGGYELDLIPQPRSAPDQVTVRIEADGMAEPAFDGPLEVPELVTGGR